MQNVKLKSYLQLHLIVLIWGFTGVLGELIQTSAATKTWYRMTIALVVIFIYAKLKKISLTYDRKTIIKFMLCGGIIAAHWLAFFKAIEISNVSTTLATLSTGAFFASFLEPIFYGRRIVWYEVLFGVFVIFGLYLIYGVNEGAYLGGILLTLVAAFLSALFSIINAKFAEKYDPTGVSVYEIVGGVSLLSIYMFFIGDFGPQFYTLSTNTWIFIAILGVFCTAYPFVGSIKIMKYISPYTVMLTINLEPIYGIILAVILFPETEKMGPEFYIGGAIILGTIILNVLIKNYWNVKQIEK
ncbi:DMT family transporter [Flavobacterium agricola]|uniref:DMT family transporter n=1 Tax=Flavobacterium agricola TaxID=2870839 RepID=A0ABY6LYI7_9FLAO|nr:DMT family transporter [Flavobacterium agricola]UYW00459.1 DMT family transporter [Flavobacterium agricola]